MLFKTFQPSQGLSVRRRSSWYFPEPVVRQVKSSLTGTQHIQKKSVCACGGGCPRCQGSLPFQAKLKIGQPDDKYEQEADRVAEQVMSMPDPTIQRKPG